jgi:hypothetical protein
MILLCLFQESKTIIFTCEDSKNHSWPSPLVIFPSPIVKTMFFSFYSPSTAQKYYIVRSHCTVQYQLCKICPVNVFTYLLLKFPRFFYWASRPFWTKVGVWRAITRFQNLKWALGEFVVWPSAMIMKQIFPSPPSQTWPLHRSPYKVECWGKNLLSNEKLRILKHIFVSYYIVKFHEAPHIVAHLIWGRCLMECYEYLSINIELYKNVFQNTQFLVGQ